MLHNHVVLCMLVDGIYTHWSDWSECHVTCGGGVKWRNRTCVGPFYGGQECQGAQVDNTTCNSHNCPGATRAYFVLGVFIDVCVAISVMIHR